MTAHRGRGHWTTPKDIREQVRRLWQRGSVLSGLATGEPGFPKRLVLKRPTSGEMGRRFGDVQAWIASLKTLPPKHVRLEWRKVSHRSLGVNDVPSEAWVDSVEGAASLIGQRSGVRHFRELVELTRRRQPALLGWLARKPVRALKLRGDWEGLLGVVDWLQQRGRPGVYVREMDVPGVDTKFVERHRGVLAELLDRSLPESAVDRSKRGAAQFAARYGFRAKPVRVRARILDSRCALLPWADGEDGQDITLRAETFARLECPAWRAIVVENEINFLSLPLLEGTVAIFGSGYGFDELGKIPWLKACRLHYWGDIDTHGLAILDALRGVFPHAESLLMDRETLLAFRPLWVRERSQTMAELTRLTPDEWQLYDDLRRDRLGLGVRLEQERIAFGRVRAALASLPGLGLPQSKS